MAHCVTGRSGDFTSTDELYQYFVWAHNDDVVHYDDTGLDLDTFPNQSFIFEARIERALFVALCQEKDSYVKNKMYEFLIGGSDNTASALRKTKYPGEPILDSATTNGILDPYSFRPFWISWKGDKIRFGQGTVVGQKIVLQYTDNKYFRPRFLAFSGWNVHGTVIVHRPVASPSDLLQIAIPQAYHYIECGQRLDLSTRKNIVFELKAPKHMFVTLSQYKDIYEQGVTYDLLIGEGDNAKCKLVKNKYATAVGGTVLGPKLAEANTPNIMSAAEFRPFWFSWADGKIRFGTGTEVGKNIIIDYADPNPIPICHLAVSSWNDATGTMRLHREPITLDGTIKDGVSKFESKLDTGLFLSQSKQKSLLFKVNGTNAVFIALCQHQGFVGANKNYEFLIAGGGNQYYVLRKDVHDHGAQLASAKVASCLDKSKFVPYWLSWANGNIRLGSGSVVGENVILEYTDPAPIPVNWLSLYGWTDIPGNFIIQKESVSSDVIQFGVPPGDKSFWDVAGLDLTYRRSLVFEVLSPRALFVTLCQYRLDYTAGRMYNICIGAIGNTITCLNKDVWVSDSSQLVKASTPNILDDTKFSPFWLSWADGIVKVGKGKIVGQNSVLEYKDPSPIPITALAFNGWTSYHTVLIHTSIGDTIGATDSSDVTSGSVIKMADNNTYADSGLDLSTSQSLVFYLKGSTDAYLALTSTKNNYDGKIYEIVFGAFSNTCTIIRVSKQDNMVTSSSSPNVLDADNFRPFWISWINGNILAGKGVVVGEQILASYFDVEKPVNVKYLGVTGYSSPCAIRIN